MKKVKGIKRHKFPVRVASQLTDTHGDWWVPDECKWTLS